ncbi:uncharacterized protein cfap92 isoform X1 [Silurus meridionalis]|nr:uncharacterized protein cfap92 isoform X1 [Silurus meridionalis]XP_046730551.1 uncharacterized protein cfap92 isoform X1 [Silurus meridionalis]
MDFNEFNTSLDSKRSSSNDDCQSSVERETCELNNVDENAAHISESKEPDPEPTELSSHIIHTHAHRNADSSYTVTCTVSMVLAVPRGYEDDPVIDAEKKNKGKKSIIEAPKAQAHYHIEYNLLPVEHEPVKVDMVMYGLVAKVYMDNETKVVKAWQEGDNIWLGWTQSVKLNVTRELLIKLSSHKVTFRLWDTKDRVSSKAKYDRPKAFRLAKGSRVEDPDQKGASQNCEPKRAGGIKGMVLRLRALYEKQHPKKYQNDVITTDYIQPSKLKYDTDDPRLPNMEASGVSEKPVSPVVRNADVLLAQEAAYSKQSYGGKQSPKPTGPKSTTPKARSADQEKYMALSKLLQKRSLGRSSETKGCKDSTTIYSAKSGTLKGSSLMVSKKKHVQKTIQETLKENDICQNGVASAEFKVMYFLAGEMSLTDCMMTRYGREFKVLCSIALDQPLLSEELKAELNPLAITIFSASSLPSSPVSFNELEHKCMPVYCQYKFHNLPAHRTKGLNHGSKIYFNDVNVILTGLLRREELLEFLRGPPLEIEVHDRDRKAEEIASSPAIFGTEATDSKLASTALVPTKQTIYSPFREMKKLCDPCGIAKLNFSKLLKGYRYLKLNLPIRASYSVQRLSDDKNDCKENEPETAGALNSQHNSVPAGHYLKANSVLKVQVEIAHPLNSDKTEESFPFGRIIYILKYNTEFLEKLEAEILRINTVAFHVQCYNKETAQRILQGYTMDATERENKYLNALTGFHIIDKDLHLFVLEGLKDEAIKTLWETVPFKLVEDLEERHIKVLYNSGLSFSKRLYGILDVGMSSVHLQESLETIIKEPLLYIRDTVPYTCLQAMLRINHMCKVSKLEEVVQNNMFPSAEMVQSLRNEFGIVPSREVERPIPDSIKGKVIIHPHVSERRTYTPIDNYNKEYLSWKQNQSNEGLYSKNYIQANIEDIQRASSALQKQKPTVFVAKVEDGQPVYNYSIQKMNSTSLAKELMYKEMAKEPTRRFTYSQDYHSFTVVPVDIEAERKAEEATSRAAWRSPDGIVYYDFKNSLESNQHPKHPDKARLEELRKPWKENILHDNILKPFLDRNRFPWSKRHKDFELYRKPPAVLGQELPLTIHLAGEALHQEQLQAAHAQFTRWLSKILPDKKSASCSRISDFKCYMRKAGLDKLHDILKDKPMKRSLRAWNGSLPLPYTDTKKEEELHISSHTQTKCQFR